MKQFIMFLLASIVMLTAVTASEVHTLQSRVSASTDDAEEQANGTMYLNSSDLEFVYDPYVGSIQSVGMRFTNIAIPRGAIITRAYIQFKVDESTSESTQLSIYGEKNSDAAVFSNTAHDISSRTKTGASISWSPDVWDSVGALGEAQRTPDLTSIVQEIVSGSEWQDGNAMVFVATGSGQRIAESYDGDRSGAPLLYVEYVVEAGEDTTPPIISLIGDNPLNLQVGDTFTDPGATAQDNVDGNVTASIQTTSNVNTTVIGTYTVTYSVSDAADNAATASRIVVVIDPTLEVYTLQSRVSAGTDDAEEQANGTMYLNSSDLEFVYDPYVGSIQSVGMRFTNIAIPRGAIITRAYIQFKVDESTSESTQLSIYGEKNSNAAVFSNTAYDISSRTKTGASISWSPDVWDSVGALGEAQRTPDLTSIVQEIVSVSEWQDGNAMVFVATGSGQRIAESYDGDRSGAPLLYVEYVVEAGEDTTPPIISLIGDNPLNLQVGDTFTDPGATAQDNVDGPVTVTTTGTVDTSTVGTYLITYTATDTSGNIATATRTVSVLSPADTMPPVITVTGNNPETVIQNATYTDAGATAEDDRDGTVAVIPTGSVDTSTVGTYLITYTATDTSGNIATATRTVSVLSPDDTTPPVITVTGNNPETVMQNATYTDAGATAEDDIDGTVAVIPTGSVDTSTVGTYLITYTATDSAGNTETATRTVNVVLSEDTTPPVITILGDNPLNLQVGDTFIDPGATAQDNVDGNVTASIQTTSNVNTTVIGTYTVTYSVSDAADNAATASRIVVVIDPTLEVYTLQSRVSAGTDDAEEQANGTMYLNSSDLEFVYDPYVGSIQSVGMRFTNIAIPRGAIITRAYIQFKVDESTSESTQLSIYGEKNSNAAVFSNTAYDISSRTKTGASISWSPDVWDSVGALGEAQRTPDLTSIVQEIVSVSEWQDSNAMVFVVTGSGQRIAESYDGDRSGAPLLYVEYMIGNTAPVANAGSDQVVGGEGTVVTLDGSASSDADGDDLSYSWTLTAPTGSSATLDDTNIVDPTFVPDVGCSYIVRLTVNDGIINSVSDMVTVSYYINAEELTGGISLSFDDAYVDSWYAARDLLNKYDAKVTFFVSYFDRLSEEQIEKLRILKSDGHEIASHSLHHLDITGELFPEGGYGPESEVERYIQEEIDPSIELMSAAGLPPLTFAVPYSRRNQPYEDAIMEKFSFVRNGAWVGESDITTIQSVYYTCLDQANHRTFVDAFSTSEPIESINKAMDHAVLTKSVVLILGHSIGNPSESGISSEKLEEILSMAQEKGLKFYTVIGLGTHCL